MQKVPIFTISIHKTEKSWFSEPHLYCVSSDRDMVPSLPWVSEDGGGMARLWPFLKTCQGFLQDFTFWGGELKDFGGEVA